MTGSGSPRESPLARPEPWDLVAAGYEEITRKHLEAYARSGLAMLDYGSRTRVLDVACGPGTTALLLAPDVRQVTCLDFSPAMLGHLRRNVATAGLANVEIVEGDGQALPFPDDSFDLGVSKFGLMFFPDRAKGFAELRRVIVPGGQVLVSSWAAAALSPLQTVVVAALQPDDALMPPAGQLSGLEDPEVLASEMKAAGFIDVAIRQVTHALPVTSVDGFWEGMVRATVPVTLLKRNSSEDEWAAIERRALRRLRDALPVLPTELAATAHLATARKLERQLVEELRPSGSAPSSS